jgi:hypothetical protein
MQDFQGCGKEIRFLFQIQPKQTVTFQGQTFGAHPVIDRLPVTVGQKLAEMPATNGTFHLVAPVKGTNQKTEEVTAPDQKLAWEQLCEQADEFFHHSFI